jgi:hypothetical protein
MGISSRRRAGVWLWSVAVNSPRALVCAHDTSFSVQLPHDTRVRLQGFVDAANNKEPYRQPAEPAPAASTAKAGGGKRKKPGQGQGEKYKS